MRSHVPSLIVPASRRGSVTSIDSGCGTGPRHVRTVPMRSSEKTHCHIACSAAGSSPITSRTVTMPFGPRSSQSALIR